MISRVSGLRKKETLPFLILFIGVLFLVLFVRIRLLSVPLERDEGEYAYSAQLILNGYPPFAQAYTMKLPGTPILYAVSMLVFGATVSGIHTGLLIVNIFTMLGVVFLTLQWTSDWKKSLLAGSSYGILSLSWAVMGIVAHATHYVVFFAVWALVLFNRALRVRQKGLLFLSGVLFGCSFLMKQPGILFALFALYLVYNARKEFEHWWINCCVFIGGFITPLLLLGVWLFLGKTLQNCWFWCVQYGFFYGSQVSLTEVPEIFWSALRSVTTDTREWWLLAVGGILVVLIQNKSLPYARAVLVFGVCSFIATALGFYFRQHYFILLLPFVSIVASVCIVVYLERAIQRYGIILGSIVIIVLMIFTLWNNSYYYFRGVPQELTNKMYGMNPFDSMQYIARIVQERTQPSDRIQVFGSEPELYFYTQRKSSSGFLYMYPLVESASSVTRTLQGKFIQEVERNHPKIIVFCMFPFSWLVADERTATPLFQWIDCFLNQYYKPFFLLEYADDTIIVYEQEGDISKRLQSENLKIVIYEHR